MTFETRQRAGIEETITCLELRNVTHLSLDNDLGEDKPERYKVLNWLEETIFFDKTFPVLEIFVHSANSIVLHKARDRK